MMEQPSPDPLERRPIKSRNTRWAERITRLLVRSGVSPNTISLFGMFAAMLAGTAFFATNLTSGFAMRVLWLTGGLLCQSRLLCNLFDGMVAVERQIASREGEIYNEVPDRISDSAILIGLGYAAGGNVAAGYLAALVAVFVAYVRSMARSIGAPNDFSGPMAKPQRMAIVTLLCVYMAFVPDTWWTSLDEPTVVLVIIILGGLATAARRLMRAARFLREAEQ